MKRSKFLVPLSWEHHSALVNANRIKLGVQNQGNVADIRAFIVYIWQHDLLPHFTREEQVILNHDEAQKISEEIKDRIRSEHEAFKGLYEQITNSNNEDRLNDRFERFAALLVAHVRYEENTFFPAVEQHFSQAALHEIGKALKEQHVPGCITWQPAFWKRKH